MFRVAALICIRLLIFLPPLFAQNDTLTIRQIQEVPPWYDISPYVGQTVVTGGIVTVGTDVYYAGSGIIFFLEQTGGGPFSGIMAFNAIGQEFPNLGIGDSLVLTAVVNDNGMTLLDILDSYQISPGFSEPLPGIITASIIDSTSGSDSLGERFEGVFTRINGLTVDSVIPYSNISIWLCHDSTGLCVIRECSDSISFLPSAGDCLEFVQGVIYQQQGAFELWPRYPRDYQINTNASGEINAPLTYSLYQNCPNPFNFSTIISFSLQNPSAITLDIYDILGRKIETLAEGIKPAGNHKAIWDASNQASGIYFYRIKVGDKVQTKKMLLLK